MADGTAARLGEISWHIFSNSSAPEALKAALRASFGEAPVDASRLLAVRDGFEPGSEERFRLNELLKRLQGSAPSVNAEIPWRIFCAGPAPEAWKTALRASGGEAPVDAARLLSLREQLPAGSDELRMLDTLVERLGGAGAPVPVAVARDSEARRSRPAIDFREPASGRALEPAFANRTLATYTARGGRGTQPEQLERLAALARRVFPEGPAIGLRMNVRLEDLTASSTWLSSRLSNFETTLVSEAGGASSSPERVATLGNELEELRLACALHTALRSAAVLNGIPVSALDRDQQWETFERLQAQLESGVAAQAGPFGGVGGELRELLAAAVPAVEKELKGALPSGTYLRAYRVESGHQVYVHRPGRDQHDHLVVNIDAQGQTSCVGSLGELREGRPTGADERRFQLGTLSLPSAVALGMTHRHFEQILASVEGKVTGRSDDRLTLSVRRGMERQAINLLVLAGIRGASLITLHPSHQPSGTREDIGVYTVP